MTSSIAFILAIDRCVVLIMAKIDFSADYDGGRTNEISHLRSIDYSGGSASMPLPNLLPLDTVSMSVPTSTHRTMSKTPIPPALIVSLVAPPWAVAIVVLNSGAQLLEQLGVASEEIFRGDRLPVLHFPVGIDSPVENQPN